MISNNKSSVLQKPFFSIIVAAYNVEKYIGDTIDSILGQTLDKKMTQLIIVDDGSKDDTAQICKTYATRYPNIITYIHQKNKGVAAARNTGLKYALGDYVNFLDGDDLLDSDALEKVYNFISSNTKNKNVNIFSIPLEFFGSEHGNHILNEKFHDGNRIVNLEEEPHIIQMSAASAFIKRGAILHLKFDEKLKYAEDAKLIQYIFLNSPYLGLISNTKYKYRKRIDGNSAIQNSYNNKSWYQDCLNNFHLDIIDKAKEKYSYVPKFIQYVLAYDLQWRISQSILPSFLTDAEKNKYRKTVLKIYNFIDDDVIIAQKNMFIEPKFMVLTTKHNSLPSLKHKNGNVFYTYKNLTPFFRLSDTMINIELIDIKDNHIFIEGWFPYSEYMNKTTLDIAIRFNDKVYKPKFIERSVEDFQKSLDIPLYYPRGFRFDIPLPIDSKGTYRISFILTSNKIISEAKNIQFQSNAPLAKDIPGMTFVVDSWRLWLEGNTLILSNRFSFHIRNKIHFIISLIRKHEKRILLYRFFYHLLKLLKRREIWLISDRISKAGDNGEAFFSYLASQKNNIKIYFLLDRTSEDYESIKKIGPVIKIFSVKHKIVSLLADYDISSMMMSEILFPFKNSNHCLRDILSKKKLIFLQHGITKDDISPWMNKYNYNLYGFVTAAHREYQSIIDTNTYYYNKENVWLTGFPRFDVLYDDSNINKIITIMPTWRKWLLEEVDKETGERKLSGDLKTTEYYHFYNGLINNPKLMNAVRKYNYKLWFMPHPNLMPYIDLFDNNFDDCLLFCANDHSYKDIFAKSKMIISDYSSVVFDFAYLRKPVIYTQFDKKQFFSGEHTLKKGYYDYEKDGFGEVEYDLDATVERIIEYIKNDCILKEKYKKRIDTFFAFNDKNNCERVYKKIVKGN